MKIQILSDLHLEGGIPRLLKDFKPSGDVLVLAGDITSATKRGALDEVFGSVDVPILYVLGNHEYYRGEWTRTVSDYREWVQDLNQFYLLNDDRVKIEINGESVYFIG